MDVPRGPGAGGNRRSRHVAQAGRDTAKNRKYRSPDRWQRRRIGLILDPSGSNSLGPVGVACGLLPPHDASDEADRAGCRTRKHDRGRFGDGDLP